MKPALILILCCTLAACTTPLTGDPRSQLERQLDIPVELAGRIHPARLAHLKFVTENDALFTQHEQETVRRQVLGGGRGLTFDF